jgi:DNA-directed RNA polymerase subunit RPC12/RpoP
VTFKAARYPTCGGDLQVHDDRTVVKCMYCGGEVIVREAIRLAAGRVREFTTATAVEKVIDESTPFPVEQVKNQSYFIFAVLIGIGLLSLLCAGGEFGVIMIATSIVIGIIMLVIRSSNIKKLEQANEEMSKIQPRKVLMAYKGHCPYCDTKITLPPNVPGADCSACNKRIVIRDTKFFSVDTPVSGIKLPE